MEQRQYARVETAVLGLEVGEVVVWQQGSSHVEVISRITLPQAIRKHLLASGALKPFPEATPDTHPFADVGPKRLRVRRPIPALGATAGDVLLLTFTAPRTIRNLARPWAESPPNFGAICGWLADGSLEIEGKTRRPRVPKSRHLALVGREGGEAG